MTLEETAAAMRTEPGWPGHDDHAECSPCGISRARAIGRRRTGPPRSRGIRAARPAVQGPAHGYRLAAALTLEGALSPILRLKMSQMYAYLHTLERQGWLLALVEVDDSAQARRVVALTPEGECAFVEWVRRPVVPHADEPGMSACRFVLSHRICQPEATLAALTICTSAPMSGCSRCS